MDDLISRQAAIRAVNTALFPKINTAKDAEKALRALPSAQPETSKAKIVVGKSKDGMTMWYQCDMCNEPVDANDAFCRGCGRRLTYG